MSFFYRSRSSYFPTVPKITSSFKNCQEGANPVILCINMHIVSDSKQWGTFFRKGRKDT